MDQPLLVSDDARSILDLAAADARRRGQAALDVEHVLRAMAGRQECSAFRVLAAFRVNAARLQKDLDALLPADGIFTPEEVRPSAQLGRVMERAAGEARALGSPLYSAHILLGILVDATSPSYQLLQKAGLAADSVRAWIGLSAPSPARPSSAPPMPASYPLGETGGPLPVTVSPVFLALVAVTALAAALAFVGIGARIALFVMVVGGWVISLSLHEFGHAAVAYLGGDRSVVDRGYLSLNPFRYTHVFLSILMPLIFLAMGGIGLPGGAVYINRAAIRRRSMQSLMSAAGPAASLICATVLILPFTFNLNEWLLPGHREFWSGLALLAFLQLTAVFFNLLPIPGLDGFGILMPFLPVGVQHAIARFSGLAFILFFLLFFNPTPVSAAFFRAIGLVGGAAGLDFQLVFSGLELFRFWRP